MYNLYSERKKLLDWEKKCQEKKNLLKMNKRHKIITKNLALNYEKRLKQFIIDVRNNLIIYNQLYLFLWVKYHFR